MAKHDNWSTPPDLMAVLDKEFHFTQEVCAAADNRALPHVPYMGLDNERDALYTSWELIGNTYNVNYCNPPYSMLPDFIGRAWEDSNLVGSTNVLLIPAYTDTNYWWDYIHRSYCEVRLLKGRLKFWESGKPGKDTARFASAVVIFKPDTGMLTTVYRAWDWKIAVS